MKEPITPAGKIPDFGKNVCPNPECRKQGRVGDRYCRKCGSHLGDPNNHCDRCGAEVLHSDKHCHQCGRELNPVSADKPMR